MSARRSGPAHGTRAAPAEPSRPEPTVGTSRRPLVLGTAAALAGATSGCAVLGEASPVNQGEEPVPPGAPLPRGRPSRLAHPLRVPFVEPEDVAAGAVFLASDEARFVSGATYDVTAGIGAVYTA